jgi:hypothetical protein
MDDNGILAAARAEEQRLLRRLDAVRQLIHTYAPEGPLVSRQVTPAMGNGHDHEQHQDRQIARSETARVLSAVENYLRGKGPGARAQTTELYEAVIKAGVEINEPTPRKAKDRISSHLSAAKNRFDNVRGLGYGLKEATMSR